MIEENISKYVFFPFQKLVGDNLLSDNPHALSVDRIVFEVDKDRKMSAYSVKTDFTFQLMRNRFTNNNSAIIICSKDNGHILNYSLSKIKKYGIDKKYDILLIDDRSSSGDILKLSDEFNTSYLKIENSDDIFNYSVINNIGVSYLKSYNKKTVIFYNNDMWPSNEKTFDNILNKHYALNSGLTGCRLVYPTENDYLSLGKPQHLLDAHLDKIYHTIQHGGINFRLRSSFFLKDGKEQAVYAPSHLWRFYKYDNPIASTDSRCLGVTGALHIIDIDNFMKIGGLNPSMANTFQDIDLCMKLLDHNISIHCVGSEYMYHAESISIYKDKLHTSPQFISDNILWEYLWGNKVPQLIGIGLEN
jgi:GT2 family glycosyltransferase